MLARATTFCLSLTDSSLLFLSPRKMQSVTAAWIKHKVLEGLQRFTCRTTHKPLRSAPPSHGLLWHTGHQTHTTGHWSHSDSKLCSVHLQEQGHERAENNTKLWLKTGKWHLKWLFRWEMRSRTSCGAVVTDDWQQIVSGDLGWTVFSQERLHV